MIHEEIIEKNEWKEIIKEDDDVYIYLKKCVNDFEEEYNNKNQYNKSYNVNHNSSNHNNYNNHYSDDYYDDYDDYDDDYNDDYDFSDDCPYYEYDEDGNERKAYYDED